MWYAQSVGDILGGREYKVSHKCITERMRPVSDHEQTRAVECKARDD